MEFRILGPLQVHVRQRLPLAGQRQQRLLAGLLLVPNRVAPLSYLIDAVWDDDPPATAKRQLQNSISALRPLLDNGPAAPAILSDGPGYRLRVAPHQLDALLFADRIAEAQALMARHNPVEAADLMRSALDLWQGPALAGTDGRVVRAGALRLDEQRQAAIEQCVDLELALGRQAELVGELAELVANHPLRERLVGQLMLALYRTGRQAEALQVYHQSCERFADELGLDPGPALRQLHTAILCNDSSVAAPKDVPQRIEVISRPEMPAPPSTPTPAQLPPDVPGFTGRDPELARLDALVEAASGEPPAAVVFISAVSGTAGVGKTALAVHWAHRVADRFPDGQLYVNLRGFDHAGTPTDPADALRGFLDALDVPAHRIPTNLNARVGLYRSLLADRRMLIVADNARDVEHVRPLLPGAPGCLVLVTSRHQLTGLVAAEGAHPLPLDLLADGDARDLLARRLGAARLAAEPDAADEIVRRCAGLPLALVIAAAHAGTRPGLPLAALAEELRDARDRLDALSTGDDPATDVRAVFSWSYHALTPAAARMFRLLGLHPGPDIAAPAAASLAGIIPDAVRPVLAELTRASLLTEHVPGRYTCHDLLHDYATHLAHAIDADEQRHTATGRILDHYLHTAHPADRLLNPTRDSVPLAPPRAGVTPQQLTDHAQAMGWFTAERPVLLAAVAHAAATGFDTHTWQLARTLANFLNRRGHWHDQVAAAQAAVAAAQRLADPTAQVRTHRDLALAYIRLGRLDDAHTQLRHALDLAARTGDQTQQAHTHHGLSILWERWGRPPQALHHAQQALHLFQATGHQAGQANALNMVGWYHALLGEHQQALTYCRQALPLHQQLGDRYGQAATWDSLGYAHHHLGHHTQAITCYQHALTLYQDLGDRYNEADVLTNLGDTHYTTGNPQAARDAWQQALTILNDLDHPNADTVRTKLAGLDPPTDETA
jgi:DNA-binding SARP family transcriptional activator/Tfp pilus assembly protein PilF